VKRLAYAAVALALATAGCSHVRPSSAPIGAAAELTLLADTGSKVIYQATYRYSTAGPLTPGVATRMEIVQRPPSSVRKLETSTPGPDGRPVTVRTWQATDSRASYSCTDYAGIGVRCLPNALPPATFHSAQLDELFDAPRRTGFFGNVARAAARARIAGQVATCFEGQPAVGAESAHYELCYTTDGVLLRARRTVDGSVPSGADARREALVEAISITSGVKPADLQLPGPIADPRDVRQ
jgi:hypothetical protein